MAGDRARFWGVMHGRLYFAETDVIGPSWHQIRRRASGQMQLTAHAHRPARRSVEISYSDQSSAAQHARKHMIIKYFSEMARALLLLLM